MIIMLKTFMTGLLLLGATALPMNAQQGPGCGRYDNCYPQGGEAYYGRICTNSRSGRLNVRTGPGTNYRSLTQIPNGTTVPVFDRTSGQDGTPHTWQRINYNGVQGWVRSDYICD
ncbi:unknown [Crocosphaera subtropica ATCC 51142]|uniref:SH3b domain-containing protein n=2 Tax=Crocosphaera TaxID=263510 RepID=B1WW91_CROS5|nr:unknown [Crocosphaera subtropica ATCC 51142]